MIKSKTVYICEKCQYESPKWAGKCPECGEWNSFQEDVILDTKSLSHKPLSPIKTKPQSLFKISRQEQRFSTGFKDFDLVLGGGIKIGSLILMSGEPGIGKSTLTLQLCKAASEKGKVLYISGEESAEQISSRAARLKISHENIQILNDNILESIIGHLEKETPQLVIVDSIQVMSSMDVPSISGSINQVRFCTEALMEYAKRNNITVIIIGHITKDGSLAGPKILEHLVDTVLFMEGDRYHNFRVVRSLKNRFGSTSESSIMEMTGDGMKEIENPSKLFLEGRKANAIGSAITVTMEGTKPILLEVQALTNTTVFGYPKRTASGFDLNRTNLLAAVISKYLKINLNSQDLFINVIGGLKLKENANDLAVAMAIISSYKKIALPENAVFLGEIGLCGELRSVNQLEKRVKEAQKLGFTKIITAKSNQTLKDTIAVSTLTEALALLA
jgi:DNA repair protein RadA/Sms